MTGHFGDRLTEAVLRTGAPACVGIDPFLDRIPVSLEHLPAHEALSVFGSGVSRAVAGLVPVVKPQSAFFETVGSRGVGAFELLVADAKDRGLLVIADVKRGDIGSTAEAYAKAVLDDDGPTGADAATLNPYLGPESLEPFLKRLDQGKGIFVLVRTSNPGAADWQADIAVKVAEWVNHENEKRIGASGFGPIGVVIGATLGKLEVASWRKFMPSTWFLVPGFGAQGAGIDDVRGHARADGLGALVVSAREVLFPAKGRDGAEWEYPLHMRARAFRETSATLLSRRSA